MKKIILILLFLFWLMSCAIENEDKQINSEFLMSNYDSNFHELDLSNKWLTMVPNFWKYLTWSILDDVWYLNLSVNQIEEFDYEKISIFPNLKDLNLSYNNIKKINIKSNTIEDLRLHKNKIEKVDLIQVNSLLYLNLWYNNLVYWNNLVLPDGLKILELQHNKLIDLNWIDELSELEKLKVEFNELENNDFSVFKWLTSLKFISAWYNKITKELEEEFMKFNEANKKN